MVFLTASTEGLYVYLELGNNSRFSGRVVVRVVFTLRKLDLKGLF